MLHPIRQRDKRVTKMAAKRTVLWRCLIRKSFPQGRCEWRRRKRTIDHPWNEVIPENRPQRSVGGKPCPLNNVEGNEAIEEGRVEKDEVDAGGRPARLKTGGGVIRETLQA